MAKKNQPKASSGPQAQPALKPSNDPFASQRDKNMRIQHYSYAPEVFDPSLHDHQVALETIMVLNYGLALERDLRYRGNVFTGSEEVELLELHWLALLFAELGSGRLTFQAHACQPAVAVNEGEFVRRILSIRTGSENNPASYNDVQRQRWDRAAKLVADWQMPISMIALATCEQAGPTNLNLRLFVPHEPEMIYNTMALRAWHLAIEAA